MFLHSFGIVFPLLLLVPDKWHKQDENIFQTVAIRFHGNLNISSILTLSCKLQKKRCASQLTHPSLNFTGVNTFLIVQVSEQGDPFFEATSIYSGMVRCNASLETRNSSSNRARHDSFLTTWKQSPIASSLEMNGKPEREKGSF